MQNIFIGFFDAVGGLLKTLLPNLNNSGTGEISGAVQFIVKFIAGADYLFPVTTLFQITGIVVGYHIFLMGVWLVNWVIKLIRG